jgi:hypothetical protein
VGESKRERASALRSEQADVDPPIGGVVGHRAVETHCWRVLHHGKPDIHALHTPHYTTRTFLHSHAVLFHHILGLVLVQVEAAHRTHRLRGRHTESGSDAVNHRNGLLGKKEFYQFFYEQLSMKGGSRELSSVER